MTEKHDETCENCGHLWNWHHHEDGGYCTTDYCSCKKFTPKTSLDKKSKGCGKVFSEKKINHGRKGIEIKKEECGMGFWLGNKRIILLCPSCEKPQNHSPTGYNSQLDTPSVENTNEVIAEGTQNQNENI